ncbi:hypothetical protein L1987_16619 [Smallanthus sonchifolius]|uniref:Uncharacterized protein n=1 Tax=Smallanthus sonchifolius TaxID=185202 RepID=A0ACB9IWN0_9ASTR|nr:hypothetical protein L1987_16619 [Smallanthus sonchifolius]
MATHLSLWDLGCKRSMEAMKAFMGSKPKENEYPAFTNFTIKVHVKNSWQDTVKTVLKSVQGVTAFKMEDDGKINISGYIDPNQLLNNLKKVGKKAEMVHWQYGECSNNLFQKTEPPPSNNNGNGNGAGGYYLYPGYGGYNGYGHNYDYPRYVKNYAYNHLECSGNAQDCNGHHTEQPKNSDKSSLIISKKITESGEDPIPIPGGDSPKCCRLM